MELLFAYNMADTLISNPRFDSDRPSKFPSERFFQIDANERALSANQIDALLIPANQRLSSKHQFENPPE